MPFMTKTNLRRRGVIARRALKALDDFLFELERLDDEALVTEVEGVDLWGVRRAVDPIRRVVKRIETDGVDQLNGIDRGITAQEF